jgi:2-polyprenyl-3-methyl-5-hydroxy-6-metoxy-1,4-benzoquinol methylase
MATAVYGADYHRPDEATVDARHERHYARQIARLERCLDAGRRHLLDVGCGAGAFLRFVNDRGWEAEGTDMVVTEWARASGAKLWAGELPAIDFGNTHYDVVRFNHVLEHTRDPLLELRRAHELVAPGGIVLIGVPNVAGLSPRLKSWQSRLGLKSKRWRHYAALHHLWFFTPTTLRRLAEAAGFDVVRVETPTMDRPDRSAVLTGAYRGLLETCRAGSLLDLYTRAR